MILHLYFARRFAVSFFMIFALFGAMTFLFEMVDNLRRFSGSDVGIGTTLRLTALAVPEALYHIIPLITVIAAITLFMSLARSSELVVARASGRSAMRSLAAPVGAAFAIGLLLVAVFNPIVAATSREHETQAARLSSGSSSVLSVNAEGLWLRQGDAGGQTVIRAARADLDGTRLARVTFIGLGPDGNPATRIEAATAELGDGAWALRDAKVWQFGKTTNPERAAVFHARYSVPSDLTPDQIRNSFGTPSAISFWDLPVFIARLEAAGFSALGHRVWYEGQMSLPVMLVAMVMITAVFTLRHTRMGRTGVLILSATLCGFTLHFVRNFAGIMAENGQIAVGLAIWAPPVAAILLSLGVLLHLEDG